MPPKKMVEVEEPIEAQPPAGVVLEEPVLTEATDEEMAALRAAAALAVEVVEEDVPVEVAVVASNSSVKFGDFVSFVLDQATIYRIQDLKVSVGTLCPGDVVLGLVISEDNSESAILRLFVDTDAVPVVRGVKSMVRPSEVTMDHAGMYFV